MRLRGRREELFDQRVFGGDVAVNLVPVRVVIGQSRVDLRQRQMVDFGRNFFGAQAEVVPSDNPPDSDAGARDARPAFADLWRSLDQGPDVNDSWHFALD
jgi:hypothetical protein